MERAARSSAGTQELTLSSLAVAEQSPDAAHDATLKEEVAAAELAAQQEAEMYAEQSALNSDALEAVSRERGADPEPTTQACGSNSRFRSPKSLPSG